MSAISLSRSRPRDRAGLQLVVKLPFRFEIRLIVYGDEYSVRAQAGERHELDEPQIRPKTRGDDQEEKSYRHGAGDAVPQTGQLHDVDSLRFGLPDCPRRPCPRRPGRRESRHHPFLKTKIRLDGWGERN